MPTYFHPIMTQAGKMAAINASHSGLQLQITDISFGRGGVGDIGYTPTGAEVALKNEVARIHVHPDNCARVGDNHISIAVTWSDSSASVPVNEIGIWAGPTLVEIFSRLPADGGPIGYKSIGADYCLQFDLKFDDVPPNSITVNGSGLGLFLPLQRAFHAGIDADLAISNTFAGNVHDIVAPGEYYYLAENNGPTSYGLVKVWRESPAVISFLAQSLGGRPALFVREVRYPVPGAGSAILDSGWKKVGSDSNWVFFGDFVHPDLLQGQVWDSAPSLRDTATATYRVYITNVQGSPRNIQVKLGYVKGSGTDHVDIVVQPHSTYIFDGFFMVSGNAGDQGSLNICLVDPSGEMDPVPHAPLRFNVLGANAAPSMANFQYAGPRYSGPGKSTLLHSAGAGFYPPFGFKGATDENSEDTVMYRIDPAGSGIVFSKTTGIPEDSLIDSFVSSPGQVGATFPETPGDHTFYVHAYDSHGAESAGRPIVVTVIAKPETTGLMFSPMILDVSGGDFPGSGIIPGSPGLYRRSESGGLSHVVDRPELNYIYDFTNAPNLKLAGASLLGSATDCFQVSETFSVAPVQQTVRMAAVDALGSASDWVDVLVTITGGTDTWVLTSRELTQWAPPKPGNYEITLIGAGGDNGEYDSLFSSMREAGGGGGGSGFASRYTRYLSDPVNYIAGTRGHSYRSAGSDFLGVPFPEIPLSNGTATVFGDLPPANGGMTGNLGGGERGGGGNGGSGGNGGGGGGGGGYSGTIDSPGGPEAGVNGRGAYTLDGVHHPATDGADSIGVHGVAGASLDPTLLNGDGGERRGGAGFNFTSKTGAVSRYGYGGNDHESNGAVIVRYIGS